MNHIALILVMVLSLSGCGFFAKKPAPTNPLCVSECPDLTALANDSFGATTSKLKDVADQYYLCRKACQGDRK